MFEKAAIAANKAMGKEEDHSDGMLAAAAVLLTIREPDDDTLEFGQTTCNDAYLDPEELPADAHTVWQNMIDSILEP